MSTQSEVLRTTYVTGLRNAHAVEQQAYELLNRQVERLDLYPDLQQRLTQHIQETTAQSKRLEDILGALGESHSSLKDTAMSFMGNMAALAHMPAADEVIKNSLASFAFENFEAATYKSLITLAEQTGDSAALQPLQTSLKEEQAMAEWLDQHLAPTILRYVDVEARKAA